MTHICVNRINIIGSYNGLSPGRRQAIIWTNAGILLIWPLGTNFSEMLIQIHTFSFMKMHVKMSSAKWRPFCLGLNGLRCNRGKKFLQITHRQHHISHSEGEICVSFVTQRFSFNQMPFRNSSHFVPELNMFKSKLFLSMPGYLLYKR